MEWVSDQFDLDIKRVHWWFLFPGCRAEPAPASGLHLGRGGRKEEVSWYPLQPWHYEIPHLRSHCVQSVLQNLSSGSGGGGGFHFHFIHVARQQGCFQRLSTVFRVCGGQRFPCSQSGGVEVPKLLNDFPAGCHYIQQFGRPAWFARTNIQEEVDFRVPLLGVATSSSSVALHGLPDAACEGEQSFLEFRCWVPHHPAARSPCTACLRQRVEGSQVSEVSLLGVAPSISSVTLHCLPDAACGGGVSFQESHC